MRLSRLNRSSIIFAVLLSAMVLAGVLIMGYDMKLGPWAFSDSVEYIASAQSLAEEGRLGIYSPDGSFMPLSLHPPLYSLLIAPFFSLRVDVFDGIKWLQLVLFCASIVVISLGIFRFTRNMWYALSAGALFTVSIMIVRVYDGAMSEGLYIFLSLVNLMLLVSFLVKPSYWRLAGAAVAAGLAGLTRYIGVVNIGLGLAMLLLFAPKPWKRRIFAVLGYAVLSALPLAVWFISTGSTGSRSMNASLDIGAATLGFLNTVVRSFGEWLPFAANWFATPVRQTSAVAAVILVTLVLFVLVLVKLNKPGAEKDRGMVAILCGSAIYVAGYLLFLWISLFSSIPPDYFERMFTPTQPFVYLLFLGVFFAAIRSFRLPKWLWVIPLAAVLVLGRSNWIYTDTWIRSRHSSAMGYNIPAWRNAELTDAVQTLPDGMALYSNDPDGVLVNTRRFPYELADLDATQWTPAAGLEEASAAVIVFSEPLSKVKAGDEGQALEKLGFEKDEVEPFVLTGDGAIYLFGASGAGEGTP